MTNVSPRVFCKKHGDVTEVSIRMEIRRKDGFSWDSAHCLICVDEKLKELGLESPVVEATA